MQRNCTWTSPFLLFRWQCPVKLASVSLCQQQHGVFKFGWFHWFRQRTRLCDFWVYMIITAHYQSQSAWICLQKWSHLHLPLKKSRFVTYHPVAKFMPKFLRCWRRDSVFWRNRVLFSTSITESYYVFIFASITYCIHVSRTYTKPCQNHRRKLWSSFSPWLILWTTFQRNLSLLMLFPWRGKHLMWWRLVHLSFAINS